MTALSKTRSGDGVASIRMDLGIAGRSAIVCASSQGLGRACAEALIAEGAAVVINGRDAAKLATTADEMRAGMRGAVVTPVAADITTPEGRTALLAACPSPDILVTNNLGPQPGSISEVTDDDLAR
jgi:3-oxoacyl-[acyl-carrier protein] reductase